MSEDPETKLRARLSAHTAACLANVEELEALRDRLAAVIEQRQAAFGRLLHGESCWVDDLGAPQIEASHG